MGLDIYLKWKGMTKKDKEAQITGFENAGKVGYLRSSYNDAGFNSWAHRHIEGKDLYYILNPHGKNHEVANFVADWDESNKRAKEVLVLAEQAKDDPMLIKVSSFSPEVADSQEDALNLFKKEKANHANGPGFGWYTSRGGDFFLEDPPKVLAAIPTKGYFGVDMTLVCEATDGHDFYIEMLKNDILDFIALGKSKNAKISWSG